MGCFYDKTAKPWYLTGVDLGSIWGHFGCREEIEVDLKLVKKWCFWGREGVLTVFWQVSKCFTNAVTLPYPYKTQKYVLFASRHDQLSCYTYSCKYGSLLGGTYRRCNVVHLCVERRGQYRVNVHMGWVGFVSA